MRKNPALTYRGALRLLGKTDSRLLNTLDSLLGGLILAGPAGPLVALWGMVDQKNEAMTLVRKLVSGTAKRMNQVKGFERYELITAAHTVIVNAALFDAYRDVLGASDYAELELSEEEKLAIAGDASPPANAAEALAMLVSIELPSVSANDGLYSSSFLQEYYSGLLKPFDTFVKGLEASKGRPELSPGTVIAAAVRKYEGYFIELANDVPEFFIWCTAAGLRGLRGAQCELAAALAEKKDSLGRLEQILLRLSEAFGSEPDKYRKIVGRANRAVLTEAVVPGQAVNQIADIVFPSVERIYQSPAVRVAAAGKAAPADENWWHAQPVARDLDLFFASFLASQRSVSAPMLLLGHPGAGKSLLTKVLAARLPESAYTTVRVPLRRVDADAPVYEQIQQALDLATNRRVNWADLADEGTTTRVVFLDGLDELLQASSRGRAGYLQDVAEFQRREAEQERPVAFVVTSRTVVADQVSVPADTTLVKLEEFTDRQIADWLAIWRACNRDSIFSGRMGSIALSVAMKHRELAGQPLLLLMLAVYAADPSAPPLDTEMTNAAFYERILTNFVHREVTKRESDGDLPDLVEDQMWRLGIAAFAMFNRDRQCVSDYELGMDIMALTAKASHNRPGAVGQETISRFFFVYTAEADAHREHAQRAYEFLHATFGEYLVAHYSVKILLEVATSSRQPRRGGREYDDDLLFALLCHESVTVRQSVTDFIGELFGRLTDSDRSLCVQSLDVLLNHYRNRVVSKAYDAYEPSPVDNVRRLAVYSANLVMLRTILAPGFEKPDWWVPTIGLWRAGLRTGWDSLCRTLDVVDGSVVLRGRELPAEGAELAYYQLTGKNRELAWYQWGLAVGGILCDTGTGSPLDDLWSVLVHEILCKDEFFYDSSLQQDYHPTLTRLMDSPPEHKDPRLFDLIRQYLAKWGPSLGYEDVVLWLRFAVRHMPDPADLSSLAPVVAAHPNLLDEIPELAQSRFYGQEALLIFLAAELTSGQDYVTELRQFREAIERHHGITNWTNSRDGMLIIIRQMYQISGAVDRRRAASRHKGEGPRSQRSE